jgi:hypothetical protein
MVANYHFVTDDGATYLVDGEDVTEYAEAEKLEWTNGVSMAIAYARHYAKQSEDGVFWWTSFPKDETP